MKYELSDAADNVDAKSTVLKEYFPDGEGMSEVITKSGTPMEDAYVETLREHQSLIK